VAEPQYQAPLGHSVASHGVHGSCSKCPGSSVESELVAWRTRERARYEVARQAVAPSPEIDTAVAYERPCPACVREALGGH